MQPNPNAPVLSKPVRRRSATIDSVVRQHDPTPPRDTIYKFSNGRRFTQAPGVNPYPQVEEEE